MYLIWLGNLVSAALAAGNVFMLVFIHVYEIAYFVKALYKVKNLDDKERLTDERNPAPL